jgi:hypothetical protein
MRPEGCSFLGDPEHLRSEINPDNQALRPNMRGEEEGEIPSTRAHVQGPAISGNLARCRRKALPPEMQARTEDVVEEIIPAGDGIEHPPHISSLLRRATLANHVPFLCL